VRPLALFVSILLLIVTAFACEGETGGAPRTEVTTLPSDSTTPTVDGDRTDAVMLWTLRSRDAFHLAEVAGPMLPSPDGRWALTLASPHVAFDLATLTSAPIPSEVTDASTVEWVGDGLLHAITVPDAHYLFDFETRTLAPMQRHPGGELVGFMASGEQAYLRGTGGARILVLVDDSGAQYRTDELTTRPALSPDRRRIVGMSEEDVLVLTSGSVARIEVPGERISDGALVRWAQNSDSVAIASLTMPRILLLEIQAGTLREILPSAPISDLFWSSRGGLAVQAGATIVFLSTSSLSELDSVDGARFLGWNPSGDFAALAIESCLADSNGKVAVADVAGTIVATVKATSPVRYVQWSPNGELLAVGAGSSVRVYALRDLLGSSAASPLDVIALGASAAPMAHWSPDGEYLMVWNGIAANSPCP